MLTCCVLSNNDGQCNLLRQGKTCFYYYLLLYLNFIYDPTIYSLINKHLDGAVVSQFPPLRNFRTQT